MFAAKGIKRYFNTGFFLVIIFLFTVVACHSVDDDRIPYAPVNIPFNTPAMWETCGVTAALQHRSFQRDRGIPSNYPYTSLTYTGFGGVLLCGDIMGNPVAYDLSCPVERNRTVLIIVDEESANAYCPRCGSVYDIFSNFGVPLAGVAAQKGYALRRYSATRTAITN